MHKLTSTHASLRGAFGRVWFHREYRALVLVMLLAGISVSSYVPMLSLLLVKTLHVDNSAVGLFSLTFLASPVIGILAARYSDRLHSRIPLLVAVVIWSAVGRVAMGYAPTFAFAIVVNIAFGAVGPVLNAQTFAVLRDVTQREREQQEATIASTARTAYCLGWATGPLLGRMLASLAGYRAALATTAVFVLATLIPLRSLRAAQSPLPAPPVPALRPDATPTTGARSNPGRRRGPRAALWVFAAACLLAFTAESVRLTYLPLLAVDRLAIPLALFGVLVAVAPVIEVVASPIAGVLADRWGLKVLLLAGLTIGGLGYLAFATSTGLPGLLIGQALNACFTAIVLGLGITYAQRLSPAAAGFASSVFFGAQSLAFATGGIVGSVTAGVLELPRMFYAPMLLCFGACVLLLLTRTPENRTE